MTVPTHRRTPRPGRARRALLPWSALVVVGVLALATVVVVVLRGRHSDAAADPSAIRPGLATSLASPPVGASRTAPSPVTSAATAPATTSASTAPTARLDSAARGPVSIRIPSVDLDADVVPVGIAEDGQVAIPDDVATVGWYRYSALPGSAAGSTVLVGHVDSAQQGEGAFFVLHSLRAGARVMLDTVHGAVEDYRVVSRQQFPKGQVPLQALFATTGSPRLTLITCGGSFNETIKSYRDNIVITAVPA